MLIRIKQFFCDHNEIEIKTKSDINAIDNGYFFIKTSVTCMKCNKTFIYPPREKCCYTMHIHEQLIKKYIDNHFINKSKEFKQYDQD